MRRVLHVTGMWELQTNVQVTLFWELVLLSPSSRCFYHWSHWALNLHRCLRKPHGISSRDAESLLCQTCSAHGSRKWLEAQNAAPCSFCYPVFSTEEKDPNLSKPHTKASLKELRTRTGNFSGCPSLQIPIIWHDISLGLLLGRCQMH